MATVETVLGPVDTADLGPTYMHEHVFVLNPDVQQNYPAEWGSEDDRVADAVTKLKALAAQDEQGIVWLSYNSPEYLQQRHGIPQDLLKNIAGVGALIQKAVE